MVQNRLAAALQRIAQASQRIEAAALALQVKQKPAALTGEQRQAVAAALAELDALIEGLQE